MNDDKAMNMFASNRDGESSAVEFFESWKKHVEENVPKEKLLVSVKENG